MDLAAFKDYVKATQNLGNDPLMKKLPKVLAEESSSEKWDSSSTTSNKGLKKPSRKNMAASKRQVKWDKNSKTKRKYSSKGGSHKDSQTVVSSVLRFSKSQMGNVLGSDGKRLVEIESKAGSEIKAKVREEDIKVTISGSKEAVTRAESMIKSLAKEESASASSLPPVDAPRDPPPSSGDWEKVNKRRRTRARKNHREKGERHRSSEEERYSRPDAHPRREDKRRTTDRGKTRVWEQIVFDPNLPLGFALEENSRAVCRVVAGSEASYKGVQEGWEIFKVGGIPVKPRNVRSTIAFVVKSKKKFLINFLLPINETVNRNSVKRSKKESGSSHSGPKVDLRTLTSKNLCQILRRSGVEALARAADIFEKEEIDGDDLSSITDVEISKLLPKLGMRMKLHRYLAKLGYHLPGLKSGKEKSVRHSSTSKRKTFPEHSSVRTPSSSIPFSKRKLTIRDHHSSSKRRKPIDNIRDPPLNNRHKKQSKSSARKNKLFCIHCGRLIPPIAKFCSGCGERVKSYS